MSGTGRIRRIGFFYRSSDRCYVRRWLCSRCRKSFSAATGDVCFGQKKRQLNPTIFEQLASTNSQRRLAYNLKINRKTVVRKFLFLAAQAEQEINEMNRQRPITSVVQFDEMESNVHTKLKPVSMMILIDENREILGLGVASMPASGLLAKKARAKFGQRQDERREIRRRVLKSVLSFVSPTAIFKSDQHLQYPKDVKAVYPFAKHLRFKGRDPRANGQGELKEGFRDPLGKFNHTAAMFRANVNRLIRKTWCTTKKQDRLEKHMILFAVFHNRKLRIDRQKKAERRRLKSSV